MNLARKADRYPKTALPQTARMLQQEELHPERKLPLWVELPREGRTALRGGTAKTKSCSGIHTCFEKQKKSAEIHFQIKKYLLIAVPI